AIRVRNITQLNDPARNLAIGPLSADSNQKTPEVLYAKDERIDFEDEMIDSKLALRLADSDVDNLADKAAREETKVRELHEYLADEEGLLGTTPSIRPTRSKLLTSAFGERVDAYTDHKVMHKGVDFAADQGSDVIAPADGLVIYAGDRGSGY